ncbi:MAG: cytochrome c3 family protein [Thermodesulfobacteriota bacterium]
MLKRRPIYLLLFLICCLPLLYGAEWQGGPSVEIGVEAGVEGSGFESRRPGGLKYDKFGRIDPSPDMIALDQLPRDKFGFVDWATAIKEELISPRDSITGEKEKKEEPLSPSLSGDIIMRPGMDFMPDVVFPHDVHNLWLSCEICHPAMFKMQAGASSITMKDIWKGKFCGRCHGKVAFPVRNCFRCHSGEKKW